MSQIDRRSALKLIGAAAAVATSPSQLFATPNGNWLELDARATKHKLHNSDQALPSDLWGYNGQICGPTLRYKQGETARIRFTNSLVEPTSVHWHGIRIVNAMDGVSGLTQAPVQPGETFEYEFELPDAGTYWYHAHNNSWSQVARGLYGPLIVDPVEHTPLPAEQDIVLMLDDWRLDANGRFDEQSLGALMDWSHGGRMGNWLTVNGQSLPKIKLQQGAPTLLRLVNACNARILEIDPNRFGAKIVGYDGQPVKGEPKQLTYKPLLLGPAQRVDLLVQPREQFALEEVSGEPFPFCFFEVGTGGLPAAPYVHPKPNKIPLPHPEDRLKFQINMTGGAMGMMGDITYQGKKLEGEDFQRTKQLWAFNGTANLAEQPMLIARRFETVELDVINNTAFMHAMHVHGHHFLIEDRDGDGVEQPDHWRDTFLISPRQSTKIAFVADNPGKWLFHCHMLEHAAAGMTSWFKVLS